MQTYIVYSNVNFTAILNAKNEDYAMETAKHIFRNIAGFDPIEETGLYAERLKDYLGYDAIIIEDPIEE